MSNSKAIRERIEELNAQFNKKGGSPLLSVESGSTNSQNKGGFVGGVGYTAEKLGLGVLRSLEGISDFVVGGIADLFGGDEFAENLMKNDWVNYSHADEWYDPGKGWQFVGDVAGGVGNMLPSIIITAATAGAAAPVALAGSIASTGQFIGSAMGQSVSEATKETGSLGGKEWLYGTASGALEGGIEAISGGIGGTQVGKVLGKQLGKSTLGKIGMTVAGEGLEEVASDIANPLLKRATGVDENAKVDWKELPRTFAVGGVTGAVMGGGKRVLDAAKVGGFNNLNTIESAQELTERQADNNIRQLKGKTATYTQEDIARTKENLSKRLQKMDGTTRAQFLQANANIANQFNEDGTVKSVAPAPDTYNTNAYSASLQGREGTFAYKPISESSKTTVQAKQVMDTLTKITDGKTNIVLTEDALTTESGGNANGLYKDGIIYLNANATDYQKALTVGVHEVIHGLEGTKEYEQLAKAITEEIKNDPDLAQQYNIDKYRAAYDSILEGEWTETTKDYQAVTEIFADFLANKVANNEQLLRNLSVRNSNVVVRFLNWVRNSIAKLGESAEERAIRKDLKKLERMLVKALEAGTGGISLERVEELSKSAEKRLKMQDGNVQSVKFSENKNADGKIATARASIEKAVGGRDVVIIEMDILEGVPKSKWIDVVKDAISRFKPAIPISGKLIKVNADTVNEYLNSDYTTGIKKYDKVTYVDKMRASNQLDEIILATTNYVNEDLKHKRKDNIKEFARGEVLMKVGNNKYKAEVVVGFTSGKNMVLYDIVNFTKTDFSLTKKKVESPERQVSLIQEKQPSTSIIRENSEKSTQNAKKVEKTSTSRSSLNVDSEGNSLTAEQAEYFKDSKVRDKEGNLLVMYHQTESDFTVFDTQREGAAQSDHETPNGIFLKPTSEDIGLKGKRQMSLYVNITNPKQFYDRDMARRHWENNIEGYSDILKKLEENDRVYGEAFDNAFNSDMPRAEYLRLSEEERMRIEREAEAREDKILADWRAANSTLEKKAKGLIDMYLRKSGFDGVFLIRDAGSFGRVVQTFIALSPEQVKNTTNKKPTSNPDIRYSIDLTFAEQVDATLNGADASQTHLKLLDETPALLQEAGFPNLPVLMTAKHLKTITSSEGKDKANYHGLSVDIVKNLPEYISNPVMIADSLTRGDSVVIITEAMDSKNRPVVAAILLDGVGRFQGEHINANIMTSAYGKDNFQVFLNKIADGNAVIYWDKKKSQDLSVSLGIQFPDAITSLNSNIIIRKANAFVNNFPEKSQKTSKGRYSIDVNSPKAQRELSIEIDNYTEKQYNDFGWARANNVLTARENADFKAKYAKIKSGQLRANRTKSGEIIVAVNDGRGDAFGVDNTLVYAKGSLDNYKITKVVKINLQDETSIEIVRGYIYESKGIIDTDYFDGLLEEYDAKDFQYGAQRAGGGTSSKAYSVNQDGRRAVGKTSRASIDVNSPKEQREAVWTSLLSRYVHRLNLPKDVKVHVVELYGKEVANRIFNVWENTASEGGVDIVTAHKELERDGFSTYSQYAAEFLRDMDSTLHNIAPKVYKAAENGKDIAKNDTLRAGKKESVRSSDEIELSGRQAQQVAKYTKKKVYKKQDAEVIVNDILDGYMTYEESVGSLSGKNRKQVVQMLWEGLNKSEPGQIMRIALKVADYLIEHTVMENIHSEMAVEIHSDTIKILKPYLHNLNLDNLKEDIKYHFGNNSPYLRWGKRKGEKGIGIDVAAMELNEKGFYIEEINNVDILLRIDEAYRNAVEGIKQNSTRFVNEILGKEKQKTLRQDLARELLRAFKQHGADSELTKTLHEYDKKVQNWKEKYYEERERNSRTLYVLHKVQQLKDVERGTFANASEFKNDIFKKSIGLLGRIKYRGNLNKSGTRKILGSLLEWYVPENPILEGEVYNEEIAKMLLQLSDNMKPLTADQYDLLAELEEKSGCKSFDKLKEWYTRENLGNRYSKVVKSWLNGLADPTEFTVAELRSLENVVDYFKNFIEKYNKVYRNGKLVEAAPLVEKYIKQLQKRKRTKISWLRKPFEKYMSTFADPMAVARYYDGYEDGFFSEMLEAFRMAAIAAVEMEQTLQAPLENFYQKNKKFLKNSYDRMIEYQGEKIPVQQAMLLYMTLKREQAVRGLAYSGFKFRRENETVSVKGFASAENLDIDSLRVQALQEQETIFQQLNAAEREYISIVEKIFNEDCKKAKSETDILRQGYTNISDGYYVPIRRASIAQNVEKWTYKDEMATISEFSFNKDTVAGAKNQLFIDSLTDVLTKHVGGISQYSKLALAVDSYNILFNMNISGNPNVAINVKSESENVWAEGGRYFSELIDDIKGVAKSKGSGQKFVRTLRSGYAKYQLGANPKVWITQLSSFAAATNILDTASIIKGVTVSGKEVDKYCPLAKIRNSENSAALAQGVIERTGKIGDVLMKPIGAVDRWVVQRLFGACQIQVARGNGPKLGTEENLTTAGELLTKVILETQQNALATERSAAMRSGNEIMKSFTMFSADSMKVLGRVVDGIGEVAVLRARIRVETDAKVKAELKQRLARANKQAAKSISALVVSALFMASVALGFKWLYNKDDKDEDVGKNLATDTIGNLLGGLPFIRDVYSFFSDGYEVQNFAYVAFNDLLDSATIVKDLSNSLIEGKEIDRRELTLSIRKLTYASGQILGIPTRNMYNVAYGLTKRISPETAYKWNDAFYKSSYKSDLQKAIDNEDEEMMATIVGLMLNENVGGIEDEATRKVMDSLIASGYDILPKAVPDKIAYKEDEETVEVSLTKKQKDSFTKSYFTANEAAARMVKSTQFNKLGQEEQATALKLLYNAYYNLAVDDCLERDSTQKNVLFMAAFDPAILAAALARIKAITADTDKKGKAINGSRKSKIVKYIESLPLSAAQKYMIMGYLGYKNIKGEEKVKKYINGLKLSTAEKELLFKHCGYEN